MKRLVWILLAVAVPAISSCATGKNVQPRLETFVEVDNQALADMTVYIMRGSQRVRLGLATGLRKTRFTIPQGIVFGATTLRFYADPIGGSATPVSEEIVVTEGESVILRIPPR
ncbi:MAG TPA: hypothetical protein VFX40_03710 [Gemmatimonadaceae bacterium]|nr:hypothetical protein [Gemmatimonadaceae bacterium]